MTLTFWIFFFNVFFSFKHNKNHPGYSRESGIVWDHPGLYGIVQYRPGWSGIIWDGQSNFIKLFDAGLQCEFIRTFFLSNFYVFILGMFIGFSMTGAVSWILSYLKDYKRTRHVSIGTFVFMVLTK